MSSVDRAVRMAQTARETDAATPDVVSRVIERARHDKLRRTPLPPADVTSDGTTLSVVIPSPDAGGTQVFNGSSERDLISKLVFAQSNATAKIRSQHKELKAMHGFVSHIQCLILHLAKLPNNLSPEAQDVLKELATAIERQQQES